jgi:hypothetical protein
MATVGATHLTLLDHAKAYGQDGSRLVIAEVLNQSNPIIGDLLLREANGPTSHRSLMRTGIPQGVYRKFYQGVQPTKSIKAAIEDTMCMLEDRVEVDKDLATLENDLAAFRMDEARAHIEGIGQQLATAVFYADTDTNPERFLGLAPRYSSLSAANAQNIISCSGTGSDQTSIWLLRHSPQSLFGIFPKGSKAGIQHDDLGEGDAFDTQTPPARYRAYMDRFQVKMGLVVPDWRYNVRICNIDTTALVAESSAADLVKAMVKAMARVPQANWSEYCWYGNRTVAEYLDIQSMGKATSGSGIVTNIVFNAQDAAQGRAFQSFRGIPWKTCDAILNTEAQVS